MSNEPTPGKEKRYVLARRGLLALTVLITVTLSITNGVIMLFTTSNVWQCGPIGLAIVDFILSMSAFIASLTAFLFEHITPE